MNRFPVLAVILLALSPSVCHASETWYVDGSKGQSGDGKSWETAFVTIAEAIAAAADSDTVVVGPGDYGGIAVGGKGVRIQSSSPADPDVVATTRVGGVSLKWADGSVVNGFTIVGEGSSLFHCWSSSASILNNVITEGHITFGAEGVIFCRDCCPLIAGNIIARNSGRFAGAILCQRSSPTIVNNTIVGNRSDYGCGGIFADAASSPTIMNCIIWDDGENLYNCSATYCCIKDARWGQGNIATAPYFVDPENGDYRLKPWSPCIDAGDPSYDFSNEPRDPRGGRIDMGAYGNTPMATSKSPDTDADGLPEGWELDEFGNLDEGATDDADGDGILNIDEYRYGWDPQTIDSISAENVTSGRVYRTIQAAICEAADGDEIVVPPGRYYENVSFAGKPITVRSADPSNRDIVAATILDGGLSGTTVKFCSGEPRESVLTGFTITGGKSLTAGGVRCYHSSPAISGNVIAGNVSSPLSVQLPSGAGGGIHCLGGGPVIMDNIISDNEASGDGGGVYLEGGSPTVVGNQICNNYAQADGGGLACIAAQSPVVSLNLISGNEYSERGAGLLFLSSSDILVSGNLVTGNKGYYWGGAAFFDATTGRIVNCTIVMNEAYGIGRGHHPNTLTAVNCIIWANAETAVNTGACTLSYSCIDADEPGEGNIFADPLFVDPENGDYRLRADSPCRNAGNTAAVLNLRASRVDDALLVSWSTGEDVDGNARISGAAADIGAYERQEGPPTVSFILEYSSDLMLWESIDVGSAWQWLDEKPDGLGRRFYRIGVR